MSLPVSLAALTLVVALAACGGDSATALPGSPVPANTFIVDAASGSDTSDGSAAHPFASIQQCASIATAGQTCQVRAGTYGETVIPAHDGVTLMAYPGDTVIISAADKVAGWTALGPGVYTAQVRINTTLPVIHSDQHWPGNQLFYNGSAVPEAQWPVPGNDPLHPNWATIGTGSTETINSSGTIIDAAVPAFSATAASIHIWSGSDPYVQYGGLVSAAPGGRVSYAPAGQLGGIGALPGGYYFLVGAPEFLSANTWCYDAASQTLTWQPPAGIDPNTADVRVKQRPTAIDLSGRSNITVRGLHIVGAGVLMDAGSQNNLLDGITATYLSASREPHALGPAGKPDLYSLGILLDGSGNTLQNSTVAYSTLSGVTVHGMGNTVSNVLIHDVNSYGDAAAGIAIGDSTTNTSNVTVTQSTIYNAGRAGINVSINPSGLQPPTALVTGLEIAHNNLYNTMLLSTDGGAIYACCRQDMTGSHIHDNWIHGEVAPTTIAFPKGTVALKPYAGVYVDNGAGGVQVANNVMWASFPEIFLHGDSSPSVPTNNVDISSNTLIDSTSQCSLWVRGVSAASNVNVAHNRSYYAVAAENAAASGIVMTDNSPSSIGATPGAGAPGCTLAGCDAGNPAPPFPSGAPAQGVAPNCAQPAP